MNNSNFNNLENMISASRLSSYKNPTSYTNKICNIPKNNKELISNYIFNAKISENFYFLLQNLEVSLRNSIYNHFNLKFPHRNFFDLNNAMTNNGKNYDSKLEFHSFSCWQMIGSVKHQLRRISITDGKIISELNFGFWTKLLEEKHYTPLIWRQIFKDVFPNFPHGTIIDHDVPIVFDKIDKIRKFRNRIFHYEPIFNHPNLLNMRDHIIEAIGWISLDMQQLSKIYDETESILLEKKEIVKMLSNFNLKKKKLQKKTKRYKQK